MNELLLQYADQIKSIVAHAESIGFDSVNGNYDDLLRSWIQESSKSWEDMDRNKEEVVRMTKHICVTV